MQKHTYRNTQGVALLAALFVLFVMSILAIGLLMNVTDEMNMAKSAENSERALKIAEVGLQVARSKLYDPAVLVNITSTIPLPSVDGFYNGGYFLAQLEAALRGKEKWTQWRYDGSVSGNNDQSEITVPVFSVWQTGARGVNGSWNAAGTFYLQPLYGIVAKGTYFSIQNAAGATLVRAHDETTGEQEVKVDQTGLAGYAQPRSYWRGDKTLTDAAWNVAHATYMSPMASFSNYSTPLGAAEPVIVKQTLYFTYSGDVTARPGNTLDRSSTVRLRAVNALCNGGGFDDTAHDGNLDPAAALWEFNTGRHGIGTAPAFFDPDPDVEGDEILYFAVIERGRTNAAEALDLNARDVYEPRTYPGVAAQGAEQIYVYAIVDTTARQAACPGAGSFRVKWANPFPDPDVTDWTDYPTEHATGATGYNPPFVRSPADMSPFLPEEDLLPDYRDGPGVPNRTITFADGKPGKTALSAFDGQRNQVRGNLTGENPSVSPVSLKVLYRRADGTLTENRAEAPDDNQRDPIIDLYLMYGVVARSSYLRPLTMSGTNYVHYQFSTDVRGDYGGPGWGPAGYRKQAATQVRVMALRDSLASTGAGWNWNAARSRHPTFKWNVPVTSWDPDQTAAAPDFRPANGYGEYIWDTFFSDQIAPMVMTLPHSSMLDTTTVPPVPVLWNDVGGAGAGNGGQRNLYNVVYAYYKANGFPTGGANINDTQPGRRGPTVAEGSPVNFNTSSWADSRIMVMAYRDTWDDYMAGNRTNESGSNLRLLNIGLSNPVEFYWTHGDNAAAPNNILDANNQTPITFNAALGAPYTANSTTSGKIGFPRPYVWWEALWTANVQGAPAGSDRSLSGQGWSVIAGATDNTTDPDVEGETAALCPKCLFGQGLLVLSLNHDLDTNREDLRMHALNATTGAHRWDYHLPAALDGDDANTTPAIANNLVFFAYKDFANRFARLVALDATSGVVRQRPTIIDRSADAVVLPPTIANGAVYIGTYDFSGTTGLTGSKADDYIRLWAFSPVLRLVSTGAYPFDPPGAAYPLGYQTYIRPGYWGITSLRYNDIFQNPSGDVRNLWKRKIQVWIRGQNSKWEEVRETIRE